MTTGGGVRESPVQGLKIMNSRIPIVIDTREQTPWLFNGDLFTTERRMLHSGDYSIAGHENRIVLERKSLGDAVNTFIHDWRRFRKELYRLAAFDHAAIIIEANAEDVVNHKYESDALPAAVIGRMHSIEFDHGIECLFWGPRPTCMKLVERYFLLAAKKLGGVS